MRLFSIFVVDYKSTEKSIITYEEIKSENQISKKKIEGAGETRTLSTSWSSNPKLLNLKYTNFR